MLNMAPDKAADETISFQCYPAALLYTGRPALTAVPSFFLSLSLFPSVSSRSYSPISFSSFTSFPLSSPPSYLPHRSSSFLYLRSVSISSLRRRSRLQTFDPSKKDFSILHQRQIAQILVTFFPLDYRFSYEWDRAGKYERINEFPAIVTRRSSRSLLRSPCNGGSVLPQP